jgi:DMSO/TMAO reductase YedYZ molybdopterin-dependent catalytic subunit
MSREDAPGPGLTRRDFARGVVGGLLGTGLDGALRRLGGAGWLPVARASDGGLVQLVERPLVLEPAPHLLTDAVTPTDLHFVRNHGLVPGRALKGDASGWSLTIDGLVEKELQLGLDDLRAFPAVTRAVVLQSSGYARRELTPSVRGIPWGRGAVGCARWTGARLGDILARAGVRDEAAFTVHEGEDPAVATGEPFRRGLPLAKAVDPETLVAYEMNGAPLSARHGFPARLVVPGWVGSTWQKWLRRITLVDQEPRTEATRGWLYHVPVEPVPRGTRPEEPDLRLITTTPVQSMIVAPRAGETIGGALGVTGVAWSGEGAVTRVEVSLDGGRTWVPAELEPGGDPGAWRRWAVDLTPPAPGSYELWSRAHDEGGSAQPLEPVWNPRGYLGNAVHRIPVQVSG